MALSQPGVQNAQLTLSGSKAVASSNRLLTTVAYQLDGKRTYALEAVCYQTNDLLEAMKRDWGPREAKPFCGLMAA